MIALLSLLVWLYLLLLHGRFWRSVPQLPPALPQELPPVDIVVPARDEALTVGAAIGSLLAQDYAGPYRVILVDDNSTDGTADLEVWQDRAGSGRRSDGIAADGDQPAVEARRLVRQAMGDEPGDCRKRGSRPAIDRCGHRARSAAPLFSGRNHSAGPPRPGKRDGAPELLRALAERALVPAFVYFFQMLYPFSRVNDPRSHVAGRVAGGTVLIRREALEHIGGIEAIKGALIDDVALAKSVKGSGPIFLGHSGLAASIRAYPNFGDIWQMISRTAFTQLRHSAALLALTLLGLSLVWLVPVAASVLGSGWQRACGLIAYGLAALSYLPTLARYERNRLWALLLPLIAVFYMAATLSSALDHWRGRGARWKNRAYGS